MSKHRDPLDPTLVDWPERQAVATIPFEVVNGRPVKPGPLTGLKGLNELWFWGEQACADALVFFYNADRDRFLLMIERGDKLGWAVPGGKIDPGEVALQAAVRELSEEASLDLYDADWYDEPARLVPDPRGSDEAWMVTTPFMTFMYGIDFPEVHGQSDALQAKWIPANNFEQLVDWIDDKLFEAHRPMLRELV